MGGVRLTGVDKTFGTIDVIRNVSMEIERGEFQRRVTEAVMISSGVMG